MSKGIVDVLEDLVKSNDIFLNRNRKVGSVGKKRKDKAENVVAVVSLEMLLHVFINLDFILLCESVGRNVVRRSVEGVVEVIVKSVGIVLKFVHVVGGNTESPSFIRFFSLIGEPMWIGCRGNRTSS